MCVLLDDVLRVPSRELSHLANAPGIRETSGFASPPHDGVAFVVSKEDPVGFSAFRVLPDSKVGERAGSATRTSGQSARQDARPGVQTERR